MDFLRAFGVSVGCGVGELLGVARDASVDVSALLAIAVADKKEEQKGIQEIQPFRDLPPTVFNLQPPAVRRSEPRT